MRKFILSLLLVTGGMGALLAQTVTEFRYPDTDDGIWYSVMDAENHTVQTKPGWTGISSGKFVYTYGNNVNGAVTIPQTVSCEGTDYTVTKIGDFAFSGLTAITLPETVTTIGAGAFMGNTALESISIPQGVETIGVSAFAICSGLKTISLPANLQVIPASAFAECMALTSIVLPENLVSIEQNAFSETKLSEINFPATLTSIGANAFFANTTLTSITLPEGLTQIGSGAFSGCTSLKTVVCLNTNPPAVSSNSFGSGTYSGKLQVPTNAIASYRNHAVWKNFNTIQSLPVAATGITLDKTVLTLFAKGQSSVIVASVTPADATGEITWSSSNPQVASVDNTGRVNGLMKGTATITAAIDDVSATCEVTVNAPLAASINIHHLVEDLYVGKTAQLEVTVEPEDATANLTWTSSNPEIVTVDDSGMLTGVAPGEAVITAVSDDISGTLAVKVYAIEATSVTFNKSSLSMKVGESETLVANVEPEDTTDKTIVWSSNDDSVATVDQYGVVTAVSVGHAAITATCGTVSAVCPVDIVATPAKSVTLNTTRADLYINQTLQLIGTVLPETTTDKMIEWSTSNDQVASVSEIGLVTAIEKGSAVITATCGEVSAECEITVIPHPAEGVILSMSEVTLQATQMQQLSATVLPDDAVQDVDWSSDDETVATVSETGVITAVSVGTAKITVTAGSASADCIVTVVATPAEQVVFDESAVTINIDNSVTLTATVYPAFTTDQTLSWTSDNEDVATVSESGVVTGIAPGTANITASCGPASAVCVVTVLSPATDIQLNYSEYSLFETMVFDLIANVTPANTTDHIEWSSSDESIAVVNENGIVSALNAGETIITAKCGNVEATCRITVTKLGVSTSVEELQITADGLYMVYDLHGVLIMKTEKSEDLYNLPKGIYIVNGTKLIK